MCAGTPDFFIFVRFAGHRNYWKYLYVGNMDELFKDKLIAEKDYKKEILIVCREPIGFYWPARKVYNGIVDENCVQPFLRF